MIRVGAILFDRNNIALIERIRNGQHYFILPGGRVESGETLQQALHREIEEELGLKIEITRLIVTVMFQDMPQYYYSVQACEGVFGQGHGPEMEGAFPEDGIYRAIWMPLEKLSECDLRPKPFKQLLAKFAQGDWPQTLLELTEQE